MCCKHRGKPSSWIIKECTSSLITFHSSWPNASQTEQIQAKDHLSFIAFLKSIQDRVYLSFHIYQYDILDKNSVVVVKAFSVRCPSVWIINRWVIWILKLLLNKALCEAIYTYFSVRKGWHKSNCVLYVLLSKFHSYYNNGLLLIFHSKNTKTNIRKLITQARWLKFRVTFMWVQRCFSFVCV